MRKIFISIVMYGSFEQTYILILEELDITTVLTLQPSRSSLRVVKNSHTIKDCSATAPTIGIVANKGKDDAVPLLPIASDHGC